MELQLHTFGVEVFKQFNQMFQAHSQVISRAGLTIHSDSIICIISIGNYIFDLTE